MNHNLPIQPPSLPAEYRYMYGPKISPLHTVLAGLTLKQVAESMPKLQELNGTNYVVLDPPNTSDCDRSKVALEEMTIANGWGPNWHMRLRYRQGVIKAITGEDVRMVAFPSTTTRLARGVRFWRHQTHMNDFNSEEIEQIAHNNLNPYAERRARVLEKLEVEKVSGTGMSWGATVLAADAQFIIDKGVAEITDLTFIDPATLHNGKTQKKMKSGFIKTLPMFHDAVLGTNVPAFVEAQNARYTDLHRQIGGSITGTIGDLFVPEVRAQRKAMTQGSFVPAMRNLSDLLQHSSNPNTKVPTVLVTGDRSGITEFDEQATKELASLPNLDFEFLLNLPFGHAVTNDMARVSIIGALNYERGRDTGQNDSCPIPEPTMSTREVLLQRASYLLRKPS